MRDEFWLYFLSKMDKHGIIIIEGFDHDDNDRDWSKAENTTKQNG